MKKFRFFGCKFEGELSYIAELKALISVRRGIMALREHHPRDRREEREFIEHIFHEYKRLMYAVAVQYNDNPADCQDIIQDSILRLMDKIYLLRGFSDPVVAAYVVATTRNVAINYGRRRSSFAEQESGLDELGSVTPAIAPSIDEQVISREEYLRMWSALSEEDRVLLEGTYILGLKDGEIAQILHCKPDSVRMKRTRARRRALEWMKKEESLL